MSEDKREVRRGSDLQRVNAWKRPKGARAEERMKEGGEDGSFS